MKKLVFIAITFMPLLVTGCFEDKRTPGQKIGDAATDLKNGRGIGNAAEELKTRTPGERIGDAVEDAGQDIKRNAGSH